MNELQKEAMRELENLEINHAETGRDRELCYPSVEEEEAMSFLGAVIDGCRESMQNYAMSKLHPKCRGCFKLDLICIGKPPETKETGLMCFDSGPEDGYDPEEDR